MFLADFARFLQTNGVGTEGTNLFYSGMPDVPDDAVCLYEYAGRPPQFNQDGMEWSEPGLQAIVRGSVYSNARAKIETIFQLLKSASNTMLYGTQYLRIEPIQSPFPLGADSKGRHILAVNFAVRKQEA